MWPHNPGEKQSIPEELIAMQIPHCIPERLMGMYNSLNDLSIVSPGRA